MASGKHRRNARPRLTKRTTLPRRIVRHRNTAQRQRHGNRPLASTRRHPVTQARRDRRNPPHRRDGRLMMTNLEKRVARVEAAEEVRSAFARYIYLMDGGFVDELMDVFMTDAEFLAEN